MKNSAKMFLILVAVTSTVQAVDKTFPMRFVYTQTNPKYDARSEGYEDMLESTDPILKKDVDSFKSSDDFREFADADWCYTRIAYGSSIVLQNSKKLEKLYQDIVGDYFMKAIHRKIKQVIIEQAAVLFSHEGTMNSISILFYDEDGNMFSYPFGDPAQLKEDDLFSYNCKVFTETEIVRLVLEGLQQMVPTGDSSRAITSYDHLAYLKPWWQQSEPFKSYMIDFDKVLEITDSIQEHRNEKIVALRYAINRLSKDQVGLIQELTMQINHLNDLNRLELVRQTESEVLQYHFDGIRQRKLNTKTADEYQKLMDELVNQAMTVFVERPDLVN